MSERPIYVNKSSYEYSFFFFLGPFVVFDNGISGFWIREYIMLIMQEYRGPTLFTSTSANPKPEHSHEPKASTEVLVSKHHMVYNVREMSALLQLTSFFIN